MRNKLAQVCIVALLALGMSGCTFVFQKGRRSDLRKIEDLSRQLDELSDAKRLLEERLSQEISDKQVKLQMMEKGLVITFLADVLFDSGKAQLKPAVLAALDKVARVLQENVPEFNVGIEGHTDNQPIHYSQWKSNWELSTARALSVLHYLSDEEGVAPKRLAAIGYGEYRPVSSNGDKEGRQLNRRVEIVILPKVSKVKEGSSARMKEPPANLK